VTQHTSEAKIWQHSTPLPEPLPDRRTLEEVILDSVPQMIWSAGPDGQTDYYNQQWCEFTGLDFDAVTPWVADQLIHPDDRERVSSSRSRCCSTGADYEAEYRLRHRSGDYRFVLSKARPERGTGGEILRWYGTCIDIDTDRSASPEPDSSTSENRFREMLDALPQMVWTNQEDGRQTYYNKQWYDFTGLPKGAADSVQRRELIHPEDLDRALATWNNSIRTGQPYEAEYRLKNRSGEYRWVLSRGVAKPDSAGTITWYGTTTDIHQHVLARAALHASEALNRSIIESTVDSIEMLSLSGDIVFANEAAVRELGYKSEADLLGKCWLKEVPPANRQAAKRALGQALSGRTGELHAIRVMPNGARKWHDMKITPVLSEDGRPRNLVVISRDVSDQKAIEERVRWTAHHDALTELANRTLFNQRLEAELDQARKTGACVGLLLLDLDDFKQVNDSLGHDAGDSLLCDFAERLRGATRQEDLVARLGGDEFAIILPQIPGTAELEEACDRIMAALRLPYVHDGRILDCRATIGASLFPDHAKQRAQLLKHADVALYVAKTTGRGRSMLFEPSMRAEMQQRSSMLSLAREALDEKLILPFYQPKIDLKSGAPAGFEALLRWRHRGRGIQLPGTIAAAFDDLDLAASISDRMIDQVIKQVADWLERGVPFGHVAVNASAAEFRRGAFGESLLERLHQASVPTSFFQLEVTETVFLGRGADCVEQALKLLSSAGMKIALDDFGTGYASLSHLKQFPVDVIKIDRSFVRDLEDDPEDAAIVRAVINLGQSLDIEIVAEGVETAAQERFLVSQGCDYAQGFHYAKAMPAGRVPRFLAR
jgi:diguanylate cyclase (GGDEF)-like protein/PAS domain S-box-containing protein